ncbi:MAG: hypothetical protein RQ826_09310 [Xanthomonadales bacterium]|nr:hypothetical protein [Xanthomonadales bacterium]
MAKRKHGKPKAYEIDLYEDFESPFDADADLDELSSELAGTDPDDFFEPGERFSARRKIERRNDMRRLYSQLDEWEEFGSRYDW